MGNVSSITQCINIFTRRKALKDDIQRLIDINIEFLNSLENDTTEREQAEVVMYNVNEAFADD